MRRSSKTALRSTGEGAKIEGDKIEPEKVLQDDIIASIVNLAWSSCTADPQVVGHKNESTKTESPSGHDHSPVLQSESSAAYR